MALPSQPVWFGLAWLGFDNTNSTESIMQFLLDCTPLPIVISYAQLYGAFIYRNVFYLSRTWCFSVHKQRMKRLGLWIFR